MDKKLTDSEIVKALENWIKNYEGTYGNFRTLGLALDLINRLQAENERLKENNRAIMQTIADVHTEAVKEFAERLIEKAHKCFMGADKAVTVSNIDNLLKELEGDSSAKEKQ